MRTPAAKRCSKLRDQREATIRSLFLSAVKEKKHLDEVRKEWQERVLSAPPLRISDHEYLRGVYSGLKDFVMQVHTRFSYLHPITGVRTDSSELCNLGLASQIDTNTGAFAWLDQNGKVTESIYF